jgi:hypothetical protein
MKKKTTGKNDEVGEFLGTPVNPDPGFCLACGEDICRCDCDDDSHERTCGRCGGEGFIEYAEAGPEVWGEDSPSEENHLVSCPRCHGDGFL